MWNPLENSFGAQRDLGSPVAFNNEGTRVPTYLVVLSDPPQKKKKNKVLLGNLETVRPTLNPKPTEGPERSGGWSEAASTESAGMLEISRFCGVGLCVVEVLGVPE